MPRVHRAGIDAARAARSGRLGERRVVLAPDGCAPRVHDVEARELVQADRGLQIHHVVFEAGHDHVVMRRPPGA